MRYPLQATQFTYCHIYYASCSHYFPCHYLKEGKCQIEFGAIKIPRVTDPDSH
jgi:hypothetical protein